MKRFRIGSEEIAEQYRRKYLPFALRYAEELWRAGIIAAESRSLVAAKLLYHLLEVRGVRPECGVMRSLAAGMRAGMAAGQKGGGMQIHCREWEAPGWGPEG